MSCPIWRLQLIHNPRPNSNHIPAKTPHTLYPKLFYRPVMSIPPRYFPENGPKRMIEGVLPPLLGLVTWELCGPRKAEANHALQAIAHIVDYPCLSTHSLSPATREAGVEMIEATGKEETDVRAGEVKGLLTSQFLYLMSNVVSKKWTSRKTSDKIRATKVLGKLVGFLSNEEAGGFLPKVMAALHSALADPQATPALRRTAYGVMCNYIRGLSDTYLGQNLSTIVVNVLLALMEEGGGEDTVGSSDRPIYGRGVAFAPGRSRGESHQEEEERLARVGGGHGSGVEGEGKEGDCVSWSEVRRMAAGLLYHLIVEKQSTLRHYFHNIPFVPKLPDLPGLREVSKVLSKELGHPSVKDQLVHLTNLLKDQSAQVRRAALKHLLLVLHRERHQLQPLLGLGEEIDPCVEELLRGLLRMATDSNPAIRDACGACLGELGAIDPARVALSLREDGEGRSRHHGTSKSLRSKTLSDCAPWEVTLEDMALILITDHLVPAFRASTTSMEQDRVAFGIQELLKLFSTCGSGDRHSKKRKVNAEEKNSATPNLIPTERERDNRQGGEDAGGPGPMPDRLATRLRAAQVLWVVEPFWSSTYKLASKDLSFSPPFFLHPAVTISLERWLSIWCRHLISRARGPLKEAFVACRGAVRSHGAMAHFLLHHLVTDIVLFGDEGEVDQVLAENLAFISVAAPPSATVNTQEKPQKMPE
ncbi:unnamed protein product, partial [Discosporangium mesarthrocarpum]